MNAKEQAKYIYDIFWDKIPYMHDFNERQEIVKECCYACIYLIKEETPSNIEDFSMMDYWNRVGQEIMDI